MRAPRYPLRIPVRYRPVGGSTWVRGVTENISRTGILLRTGQLLPLDTPMEIQFFLSSEGGVVCEGRVTRTVFELGDTPAIGATILPRPKLKAVD